VSVKKTTFHQLGFLRTMVHGTFSDTDTAEEQELTIEAMQEGITAASPRGRIAKWRPHAERLGCGLDALREAEALIDGSTGTVANYDRFCRFLSDAVRAIEAAQVQETIIPAAVRGIAFTEGKDKGLTKVKEHKELREAFSKALVVKHPTTWSGNQLMGTIHDERRPSTFQYGGVDYRIFRVNGRDHAGRVAQAIRFESQQGHFDCAIATFLDSVTEAKKVQ
jgi:hypothetical protein